MANGADIIDQGVSERVSTQYDFIENTSGGILNKGIYIVKYEGLEEKVLNSKNKESNEL